MESISTGLSVMLVFFILQFVNTIAMDMSGVSSEHTHKGPCGHHAVHSNLTEFNLKHQQHVYTTKRLRQSSTTNGPPILELRNDQSRGIRITPEYQLDELDSSLHTFLTQDLIPVALSILEATILVKKPVEGELTLPRYCTLYYPSHPEYCLEYQPSRLMDNPDWAYCGHSKHNDRVFASYEVCEAKESGYPSRGFTCQQYETEGVRESDFYLYVTAVESEYCKSAVAYAMYCSLDLETNRPLAGSVNLCPSSLSVDPAEFQQQLEVVIHELIHSLVFTESLFEKFIDDKGVVIPLERVVENSIRDGKSVKKIITPTVVEKTREHFSCPSVTGAELEDEGGAGTAGNHWETRLFNGEIMDGMAGQSFHSDRHAFSPITLALLEDSGWYTVNWAHSGHLNWGHGAGCSFAKEDCRVYMETTPDQSWFCTDLGASSCTSKSTGLGRCETGLLLNSCNIVRTYSNGDCKTKYPTSTEDAWGTVHGLDCFCFHTHDAFIRSFEEGGRQYEATKLPHEGECYETKCNADGTYSVVIFSTELRCSFEGQVLEFGDYLDDFHSGGITCSDPETICAASNCSDNCSGNGWCSNGQCICHLGVGGTNCSQRLCTKNSEFCECEVVSGEITGYCSSDTGTTKRVSIASESPMDPIASVQTSHSLVDKQVSFLERHWIVVAILGAFGAAIHCILILNVVLCWIRKIFDKKTNTNEQVLGKIVDFTKYSLTHKFHLICASNSSNLPNIKIEIKQELP